jgi:hypothetical protein
MVRKDIRPVMTGACINRLAAADWEPAVIVTNDD